MTPAPSSTLPISGCVIAYQEADRIGDCVASLQFCDEIVVVDSGSEDRTREIAVAGGARVVVNAPFPGHREQKQHAIELARHDWVFCLDADERVTPELRRQIEDLFVDHPGDSAYRVPRFNQYLGRVVHVDHKVRLFDRRRARWGGTNPHDRVEVEPGVAVVDLTAGIDHLSYRDFSHHRRTIDSFTRIAAKAMRDKGRRANVLDLLFRPPAAAIKSYFVSGGFKHGWRGLLIGVMAGYYDLLKYWRLLRLPPSVGGHAEA